MIKEKKENKINVNPFPAIEEQVLNFWEKNEIFEKSVEKEAPKGDYVFYDGPPFATGTPHYGHIVASIMKDVVPRYWTMKGYRVERKWGWDCHGLPIENIVEKEMGSKSKKDIGKIGVAKFNELCRSKVLVYVHEWEKVIRRLGRWADMKNAYKTMDLGFMESVWWVFKQLWDKGLIYEGYRSLYVCPRCETTLSQQEIAEGYKMVKDLSATVKFELVEEPGTFVLAWTTTPWTLIGNAALAVGKNIDYVRLKLKTQKSLAWLGQANLKTTTQNSKLENGVYIAAKERVSDLFKEFEYEIVDEFKGKELISKRYKPLFDYYSENEKLENRKNGWKIYAADFVSTAEGTGVVHIAPAFGEDDMNLGKEHKLPFIQHVNMDGTIKAEAKDFTGLNVKPIGDTQKTDVEIIKYLAHQERLFHKEKYEHSYPHCWRCETPLINYATTSWFVAVTQVKDKALKLAQKINWSPTHIKEGRFGDWLAGARDWSISRQRFWASVMPIWRCERCGKIEVIGDLISLGAKLPSLYILRHGEARNNTEKILSSELNDKLFLTAKGSKQVEKIADQLKQEKIDLIISSDLDRTKQTAGIISKKLGVNIIYSDKLRESDVGDYDGKKIEGEVKTFMEKWDKGEDIGYPNGENRSAIGKRTREFYDGLFTSGFVNKKILMVSHGDFLTSLQAVMAGGDYFKELKKRLNKNYIGKGELRKLDYRIHDIHSHFVNGITWPCSKCGGTMKRVTDVLDTWFDSGSMPYAQTHYPFENKEKFETNFPAEFIAEGVDQTRAWFYYIHIIATAVRGNRAFKNVIVNGIVLAEDGKKMSKRLNNYPDPRLVMNKYGADALRYYLCASPVMKADNINFSEKDLSEQTRFLNILFNVLSFYRMFAQEAEVADLEKKDLVNVLDKWITSRLEQTKQNITEKMDDYNLHAIREIPIFINDLSTWYVRRSRNRFKGDASAGSAQAKNKQAALVTTKYVLIELAKIMAPFMPFMAEHIYQELGADTLSVHLTEWPEVRKEWLDKKVLAEMETVRKIVELGLAKRDEAGIKVRQMLNESRIMNHELREEYVELLKDELNVKKVVAKKGRGELSVELDITLTDDLKLEGLKREIVRLVNNMRKNAGLTIKDKIILSWQSDSSPVKKVFKEMAEELRKDTLSEEIVEAQVGGEAVKVNGEKVVLRVSKK